LHKGVAIAWSKAIPYRSSLGRINGSSPTSLHNHFAGVIRVFAKIMLAGCRQSACSMGVLIRMFFNDHAPPHFHARYGEFEATIDIDTLSVGEGYLPRRALALVQEWAMIHRVELLDNWRLCRENTPPEKIEPLA
jgi:hypothetical protein